MQGDENHEAAMTYTPNQAPGKKTSRGSNEKHGAATEPENCQKTKLWSSDRMHQEAQETRTKEQRSKKIKTRGKQKPQCSHSRHRKTTSERPGVLRRPKMKTTLHNHHIRTKKKGKPDEISTNSKNKTKKNDVLEYTPV